jgi:predicted kinase
MRARDLALALVARQLEAGADVIMGQYLARADFVRRLEAAARSAGAAFLEILLDVDERTLRTRLASRATHPERPEQVVNSRLVGPEDAAKLLASLAAIRRERPSMVPVDARGDLEEVAAVVRAVLEAR